MKDTSIDVDYKGIVSLGTASSQLRPSWRVSFYLLGLALCILCLPMVPIVVMWSQGDIVMSYPLALALLSMLAALVLIIRVEQQLIQALKLY